VGRKGLPIGQFHIGFSQLQVYQTGQRWKSAACGQGAGREQAGQGLIGLIGLQVEIGLNQVQANQCGHFVVVQQGGLLGGVAPVLARVRFLMLFGCALSQQA
jgi:hypothetical protein